MATYHLKAAKRDASGQVGEAEMEVTLEASSLDKAVSRTKDHPIRQRAGTGSYVWLTDDDGWTVWDSDEERDGLGAVAP